MTRPVGETIGWQNPSPRGLLRHPERLPIGDDSTEEADMRRMFAAAAITAATLFAGGLVGPSGAAESAPPQPVVDVSCETLGDFTARITNVNASLVKGATLVTGKSDVFGTGVVFDVYDVYDDGRGHAPVVPDRGFARDIVHCTVDLSDVVGVPGYVVPVGIKLTGQAAR